MTLRENNLKEIEGGTILESQGILVANRKSLLERPGLLKVGGAPAGEVRFLGFQGLQAGGFDVPLTCLLPGRPPDHLRLDCGEHQQ